MNDDRIGRQRATQREGDWKIILDYYREWKTYNNRKEPTRQRLMGRKKPDTTQQSKLADILNLINPFYII